MNRVQEVAETPTPHTGAYNKETSCHKHREFQGAESFPSTTPILIFFYFFNVLILKMYLCVCV